MAWRKRLIIILALCSSLFLISCSHKADMKNFDNQFYQGDLEGAKNTAIDKSGIQLDESDTEVDDLLWGFNAGLSKFWLDDNDTINILELSENKFTQYEDEGILSGTFSNVGATLVNDNIKDYRGNIYEGVLLNYYKALESMSKVDNATARIEFNRANDRQRRAGEYYKEDILKAIQGQNKENQQNDDLANKDTNSAVINILETRYSNIKTFGAQKGFINPSVSYLSGLFFMLENDYNKAIDYYKEAYGISQSSIINEDIAIFDKRRNGNLQKYTWVIIEDGRGSSKDEEAVNFNLNTGTNMVNLGMALPIFIQGHSSYNSYFIGNTQAQEISNFSLIANNEFNAQLPFIVSRAVASAVAKTAMQITANSLSDENGGWWKIFAIMVNIYSIATTSADTRISTILPHKVLAIRLANTEGAYSLIGKDKILTKESTAFTANNTIMSFNMIDCDINTEKTLGIIQICKNNDNILYIRVLPNRTIFKVLK